MSGTEKSSTGRQSHIDPKKYRKIPKCIVKGCRNWNDVPDCQVYQLRHLEDLSLRELWVGFASLAGEVKTGFADGICKLHFREDQFMLSDVLRFKYGFGKNVRLKDNAAPTIFSEANKRRIEEGWKTKKDIANWKESLRHLEIVADRNKLELDESYTRQEAMVKVERVDDDYSPPAEDKNLKVGALFSPVNIKQEPDADTYVQPVPEKSDIEVQPVPEEPDTELQPMPEKPDTEYQSVPKKPPDTERQVGPTISNPPAGVMTQDRRLESSHGNRVILLPIQMSRQAPNIGNMLSIQETPVRLVMRAPTMHSVVQMPNFSGTVTGKVPIQPLNSASNVPSLHTPKILKTSTTKNPTIVLNTKSLARKQGEMQENLVKHSQRKSEHTTKNVLDDEEGEGWEEMEEGQDAQTEVDGQRENDKVAEDGDGIDNSDSSCIADPSWKKEHSYVKSGQPSGNATGKKMDQKERTSNKKVKMVFISWEEEQKALNDVERTFNLGGKEDGMLKEGENEGEKDRASVGVDGGNESEEEHGEDSMEMDEEEVAEEYFEEEEEEDNDDFDSEDSDSDYDPLVDLGVKKKAKKKPKKKSKGGRISRKKNNEEEDEEDGYKDDRTDVTNDELEKLEKFESSDSYDSEKEKDEELQMMQKKKRQALRWKRKTRSFSGEAYHKRQLKHFLSLAPCRFQCKLCKEASLTIQEIQIHYETKHPKENEKLAKDMEPTLVRRNREFHEEIIAQQNRLKEEMERHLMKMKKKEESKRIQEEKRKMKKMREEKLRELQREKEALFQEKISAKAEESQTRKSTRLALKKEHGTEQENKEKSPSLEEKPSSHKEEEITAPNSLIVTLSLNQDAEVINMEEKESCAPNAVEHLEVDSVLINEDCDNSKMEENETQQECVEQSESELRPAAQEEENTGESPNASLHHLQSPTEGVSQLTNTDQAAGDGILQEGESVIGQEPKGDVAGDERIQRTMPEAPGNDNEMEREAMESKDQSDVDSEKKMDDDREGIEVPGGGDGVARDICLFDQCTINNANSCDQEMDAGTDQMEKTMNSVDHLENFNDLSKLEQEQENNGTNMDDGGQQVASSDKIESDETNALTESCNVDENMQANEAPQASEMTQSDEKNAQAESCNAKVSKDLSSEDDGTGEHEESTCKNIDSLQSGSDYASPHVDASEVSKTDAQNVSCQDISSLHTDTKPPDSNTGNVQTTLNPSASGYSADDMLESILNPGNINAETLKSVAKIMDELEAEYAAVEPESTAQTSENTTDVVGNNDSQEDTAKFSGKDDSVAQTHQGKDDAELVTESTFVPEKDPDVVYQLHAWCAVQLQCSYCSEYFDCRLYKRHVVTHDPSRFYIDERCKDCGNRYFSRENHLLSCTGKIEKAEVEKTLCEICGKPFKDVQKHIRVVHKGEKKYECKICGDKFGLNGALLRHMKVHSSVKDYVCEICGRGFTQKGNLKGHMRQHTSEKPFECYVCSESFVHNVSLKNHLKRYHGIDPWAVSSDGPTGRRKKSEDKGDQPVKTKRAYKKKQEGTGNNNEDDGDQPVKKKKARKNKQEGTDDKTVKKKREKKK